MPTATSTPARPAGLIRLLIPARCAGPSSIPRWIFDAGEGELGSVASLRAAWAAGIPTCSSTRSVARLLERVIISVASQPSGTSAPSFSQVAGASSSFAFTANRPLPAEAKSLCTVTGWSSASSPASTLRIIAIATGSFIVLAE